jgi:hypothetical protein
MNNSTAQCSPSDVADHEWEQMKQMINDQFDLVTTNLEELRKKGCLESIAHQIERGNRCASARLICWYLAMVEVEYCSRQEVSKKLDHMFQCHKNAKKASFVLETHVSRAGRLLNASDHQSTINDLEGKENLSLVQRQELWLAKKSIRQEEAQSRKREAEEKVRAQSAPNMNRSKQSFKTRRPQAVIGQNVTKRTTTPTGSIPDVYKRPPTSKHNSFPDPTRSLSNITNKASEKAAVKPLRTQKKKKKPISDIYA